VGILVVVVHSQVVEEVDRTAVVGHTGVVVVDIAPSTAGEDTAAVVGTAIAIDTVVAVADHTPGFAVVDTVQTAVAVHTAAGVVAVGIAAVVDTAIAVVGVDTAVVVGIEVVVTIEGQVA
jgi:hypothetical protein